MKKVLQQKLDAEIESGVKRPGLLRKKLKTGKVRSLSATQIIIIGFILLIFVGALILMLPVSSADGSFTDPETALFTAVSATCVTGLTVVGTGTYWSLFGQIVIILMIQIGGLGFMTLAVMLSIFVRRQITPRERLLVAQSLGLSGVGGAVRLVKRILIGTFAIEGVGAIALSTQFIPEFGVARGIYYGVFHSVSAFCNAGFDLLNGLSGFHENYTVGITLMLLIAVGGIGFIVWDDIVNLIKTRKRISVYSRFVLTVSAALIVSGALMIALFEWNNPETIGSMPVADKIYHCFFQSITTRTAGIDFIGNDKMTGSAQIISILLMLVGGASGSTAGGIKVGTFGVLLVAICGYMTGSTEIVIRKRRIPHEIIIRATTISAINMSAALFGGCFIALCDNIELHTALYETVSAISTVGLSLSMTPLLSTASHIAVMVLMFFGRVGILTITYSIMLRQAKRDSCITYPDVNMMIG